MAMPSDEDANEMLARIERVKKGETTTLDLTDLRLRHVAELPSNLKVLILNRTDVEELPELPEGIEELDIRGTQIPSSDMDNIPEGLKTLKLSDIGIEEFPPNLVTLVLDHNYSKTIPPLPSSLKKFIFHAKDVSKYKKRRKQIIVWELFDFAETCETVEEYNCPEYRWD